MRTGEKTRVLVLSTLTLVLILIGSNCKKLSTSPCSCPDADSAVGVATLDLGNSNDTLQIFRSEIRASCEEGLFPVCGDSMYTILKTDTLHWHIFEFEAVLEEGSNNLRTSGITDRHAIKFQIRAKACLAPGGGMEECDEWPGQRTFIEGIDGDSLMIVYDDPLEDKHTFEHRISGACDSLISFLSCDDGVLRYELKSFTSDYDGLVPRNGYPNELVRSVYQEIVYEEVEE